MAQDLNVVVCNGRLTRDAERRQAGATEVLNMRLAVNGRGKDEQGNWGDKPSFFDVVHFPRSEKLADWLVKGKQVSITGRLQQREYTTKDGDKRSVVEIVAQEIQLLGGAGESAPKRDDSLGGELPGDWGKVPSAPVGPGISEMDIPFAASWV
mgnify:CR=1 FL=1